MQFLLFYLSISHHHTDQRLQDVLDLVLAAHEMASRGTDQIDDVAIIGSQLHHNIAFLEEISIVVECLFDIFANFSVDLGVPLRLQHLRIPKSNRVDKVLPAEFLEGILDVVLEEFSGKAIDLIIEGN